MQNDVKKKPYSKNPLGIIALFVFFIEAISTVSLKFVLDSNSEFVSHFAWFIILFPSIIVILFFITLWFRREGLYSPTDFREDKSFLSLFQKVKRLEVIQEASQVDPRGSANEILSMLEKLLNNDEINTAIHLSRAPLKIDNFKNSYECFRYLKDNIPESHPLFQDVLSNLAFSLIGLKKYHDASKILERVLKDKGRENFDVWNASALAYSYFITGQNDRYKEWLNFAKQKKEYSENIQILKKLYQEIKDDLENVGT